MSMMNITDLQSRLVEELGIAHLDVEAQERVIDEMGGMLYQRVLLTIFDKIPADQHEKLKQLIAANLEDEISAMVSRYVENVEGIAATALAEGIADYKTTLVRTV